jgi:hypothetical protein
MKKLLLLSFALFSFSSFGQLREITPIQPYGLVKRGPYEVAKIKTPGNGMYILTYLDASYQHIVNYNSIVFDADEKIMNDIYTIFKQQVQAEKNSEKLFGLGDSTIKLVTKKTFGVPYITVYIASRGSVGYLSLNEGEIDKLFGK